MQPILGVYGLLALVMGVFFLLRGYYRFQDWKNGETDQLWHYLSMWIGGAGGVSIGIGIIGVFNAHSESAGEAFGAIFSVGLFLGAAAMVLATLYYFFKWREAK